MIRDNGIRIRKLDAFDTQIIVGVPGQSHSIYAGLLPPDDVNGTLFGDLLVPGVVSLVETVVVPVVR